MSFFFCSVFTIKANQQISLNWKRIENPISPLFKTSLDFYGDCTRRMADSYYSLLYGSEWLHGLLQVLQKIKISLMKFKIVCIIFMDSRIGTCTKLLKYLLLLISNMWKYFIRINSRIHFDIRILTVNLIQDSIQAKICYLQVPSSEILFH